MEPPVRPGWLAASAEDGASADILHLLRDEIRQDLPAHLQVQDDGPTVTGGGRTSSAAKDPPAGFLGVGGRKGNEAPGRLWDQGKATLSTPLASASFPQSTGSFADMSHKGKGRAPETDDIVSVESDTADIETGTRPILHATGQSSYPKNSAIKICCNNYLAELRTNPWAKLRLFAYISIGIVLIVLISRIAIDEKHLDMLAKYITQLGNSLNGETATDATHTPAAAPQLPAPTVQLQ